jgi:hypothetical protein
VEQVKLSRTPSARHTTAPLQQTAVPPAFGAGGPAQLRAASASGPDIPELSAPRPVCLSSRSGHGVGRPRTSATEPLLIQPANRRENFGPPISTRGYAPALS